MQNLIIKDDCVVEQFNSKFIKVFDLQYAPGQHYFDATRRSKNDILAIKTSEDFKITIPDAVSCAVILNVENEEPRLYLTQEYRYPAGRFLLSVPSGLIDAEDKAFESPSFQAAIRELKEETGLEFNENTDKITYVNPLLFCSPGMTDESTAFVKLTLNRKSLPDVSRGLGVADEMFEGARFVTKSAAKEILLRGSDANGFFYSAVTWIALIVFITDIW